MPHGDFSDLAGLVSAVAGLAAIFSPQVYYNDYGPVHAFLKGDQPTETEASLLSILGAFLFFAGMVLSGVRWNPANAQMAIIGTVTVAATSATVAWKMDSGELVPRGWHVLSVVYLLATLHLMFNRNAMWTPVCDPPLSHQPPHPPPPVPNRTLHAVSLLCKGRLVAFHRVAKRFLVRSTSPWKDKAVPIAARTHARTVCGLLPKILLYPLFHPQSPTFLFSSLLLF